MLVIYGKDDCFYCNQAKKLADENGMKYEYKNVKQFDLLAELKSLFPDVKTVPQIWIDDQHVGGYDEFKKYVKFGVDKLF